MFKEICQNILISELAEDEASMITWLLFTLLINTTLNMVQYNLFCCNEIYLR